MTEIFDDERDDPFVEPDVVSDEIEETNDEEGVLDDYTVSPSEVRRRLEALLEEKQLRDDLEEF